MITDFVIFTHDEPREARLTGRYVVESVTQRPDGRGHSPYDVYPGGHDIEARHLHDDGTYNPVGAVVCPTMGAWRSSGDNHQFLVVGHMPGVTPVETLDEEPEGPVFRM